MNMNYKIKKGFAIFKPPQQQKIRIVTYPMEISSLIYIFA